MRPPPPEPEIINTVLGDVRTVLSGVLRAEVLPPPPELSISPSSLSTPVFAYGRLFLEDLVVTTFLNDNPVITDVLDSSGQFGDADFLAHFHCGGTTETAWCNSGLAAPYVYEPVVTLDGDIYSFEEVFGTPPPAEGSTNITTFGLGSVRLEITPEPSTALLLAFGLAGLAVGRGRRGRQG